jgi:hypothetical protein
VPRRTTPSGATSRCTIQRSRASHVGAHGVPLANRRSQNGRGSARCLRKDASRQSYACAVASVSKTPGCGSIWRQVRSREIASILSGGLALSQ